MRHTTHQTMELRRLLRLKCCKRDRWACVRCGGTWRLETSHVYSKGAYRALQYDLNNVITLCNSCHHDFWHKYPADAMSWFAQKYPDRYRYLMGLKNKKIKLDEYQEIKTILQEDI